VSLRHNINLYDASLRRRFDWLAPAPAAALLGGVLLAVTATVLWAQGRTAALRPQAEQLSADLAREQAAMQALAQRRATQHADPALQTALSDAQQALHLRQSALAQLQPDPKAAPSGHAATLAALARQSTEGLWLTGLALKDRDVSLEGRALDPALIPTYVHKLNQEPALRGRTFRSLQVDRPLSEAPTVTAGTTAASAPSGPPPRAVFVSFTLLGQHAAGDAATGAERGASAPAKDTP
jgi:hypothetical protein